MFRNHEIKMSELLNEFDLLRCYAFQNFDEINDVLNIELLLLSKFKLLIILILNTPCVVKLCLNVGVRPHCPLKYET